MNQLVPEFAVQSLEIALEPEARRSSAKSRVRAHVRSIQRQLHALGAGDLDALLAEMDDEVQLEIHAPGRFPWIRRARGLAQMRAAVAHNFSTVEVQQLRVLTVVAQGDVMDVMLHATGRLACTQEPYDVTGVLQFTFRGGKLVVLREVLCGSTPHGG